MEWQVVKKRKVDKQLLVQPERIQLIAQVLMREMMLLGPSRYNWPNYGKLAGKKNDDKRHCHLVKGNPTYICCWNVLDKPVIEVSYVGTHEKAPY